MPKNSRTSLERLPGYIQSEQVADVILTATNSDDSKTRYLPGSYKLPTLFSNYFSGWSPRQRLNLVRRTVLEKISLDERVLNQQDLDELSVDRAAHIRSIKRPPYDACASFEIFLTETLPYL